MNQKNEDSSRRELLDELIEVVQRLPQEQIAEVSDFARDLRSRSTEEQPQRGSVDAILHALRETGPLQFEPDELATLLADIEAMRNLDLEKHG